VSEPEAIDPTAERVARNDATFRTANEQIGATARALGIEHVPFICECADERCTDIVRLTVVEYEDVRSSGRLFLNAPGHEVAARGWARVVERYDRYVLVEKVGDAGAVAEELDPRHGVPD
jgi:hypothetical protein